MSCNSVSPYVRIKKSASLFMLRVKAVVSDVILFMRKGSVNKIGSELELR